MLKAELEFSHDASHRDGVHSELQWEAHCPSRGEHIKDERVKTRGGGTLNTERYMCY